MRILLIEDDEHKSQQMLVFLNFNYSDCAIVLKRSYQSGLAEVLNNPPDVLLLDMTLTTFDISTDDEGGRPRPFGGREILEYMDRLDLIVPTILVTQNKQFGPPGSHMILEDLDAELKGEFPLVYLGSVYYHAALDDWKADLKNRLDNIREELRSA